MSNTTNYIKLWLKKVISKMTESSIYMFEYETFNELNVLPLDIQLDIIDQNILKYRELLNSGYPFISYNFKNGIFDEDYFFENEEGFILEALSKDYNIKDSKSLRENLESLLDNAKQLLENNNTEFYKVIEDIRINYARSKFIDALTAKRREILGNDKNNPSDLKHENIFCNNGFVLFEHILNNYVKTNRGRKSDISFFYWSMYNNNPQYIHQRPERFKEWFFDNYDNEDLGKIKTYDQVNNIDRQKHFSNALDWFKSQS